MLHITQECSVYKQRNRKIFRNDKHNVNKQIFQAIIHKFSLHNTDRNDNKPENFRFITKESRNFIREIFGYRICNGCIVRECFKEV